MYTSRIGFEIYQKLRRIARLLCSIDDFSIFHITARFDRTSLSAVDVYM